MSTRTTLLCLGLTAVCAAQNGGWIRPGVPYASQFTGVLGVTDDLNGDGIDDVFGVGQDMRKIRFSTFVFSGADGSVLSSRLQQDYQSILGHAEAGDMNGDGYGDYAIAVLDASSVGETRIEVRSSRDHSLIWQYSLPGNNRLGRAMVGDLDLNGDGKPDLIATANAWTHRRGTIVALDHSGQVLHFLEATSTLAFGELDNQACLGRAGDLDGDGCEDFVSGGFDKRTNPSGVGCAIVMSGRTGKILQIGHGQRPGVFLGDAVDGCGDVDGDGIPDFAAGSWSRRWRSGLRVFSGRTGNTIWSYDSDTFDLGSVEYVRGRFDFDRDGVPDIAYGGIGLIRVLSGRDGTRLHERRGYPGHFLGEGVQFIRPHKGDAFPVVVTAEPAWCTYAPGGTKGRIIAIRGGPEGARVFGVPCGRGGSEPKIGMRRVMLPPILKLGGGTTPVDERIRVTVHAAPAGASAVLLLGQSKTVYAGQSLPLSLSGLGLGGCWLRVAPELALPVRTGTTGINRGYAAVELDLPPDIQGRHAVFGQWLTLDSGGSRLSSASDALAWRAK